MAFEGNYEFPHVRTYDGDLGFLINRYNQLYSKYSKIAEIVENLQNALENLPSTIQQEVSRQLNIAMDNVYAILHDYDLRIENSEQTVKDMQDKVSNMQEQIMALIGQLSLVLGFIETYTDAMAQKVYNQLSELVYEWSKNLPPVICPVDGQLEPISVALKHIYDFYNRGITAYDYDNLFLTAQEYDNMRITAAKYDGFAHEIFKERRVCTMISPFTGQIDYIKNVVNRLADFHKRGITAQVYDSQNHTAETYDALNITAYEYDWDNPLIV